MDKFTALLLMMFSMATNAQVDHINVAKEYLTNLGYVGVESLNFVISDFKYDLDGNGINEIQVSESCDFEKTCLKVIFSDNKDTNNILFHFHEYDYWIVNKEVRINGYNPLLMIKWEDNFRHKILIWVSGEKEFINCSKAKIMGITWKNQEADCRNPALMNP